MKLGSILKQVREERGIYQKELAAHLSVSVGTVSNYEKGVHAPDPETLCKLAKYYNVSTDFLLGRTRYRYDLTTLNQFITDKYTVADLLHILPNLTEEDKAYLVKTAQMLEQHSLGDKKSR